MATHAASCACCHTTTSPKLTLHQVAKLGSKASSPAAALVLNHQASSTVLMAKLMTTDWQRGGEARCAQSIVYPTEHQHEGTLEVMNPTIYQVLISTSSTL